MNPKLPDNSDPKTPTKRETRDEETTLADGYLYFLIRVFGYTAKWKQIKHSEKTTKLYCVDELFIGNTLRFSQEEIIKEGKKLQEKFNAEPVIGQMNTKQERRSKEAEMSNGYLQMILNAGYEAEFKGTRSARKTIKMYRIKQLTTPNHVVVDKNVFVEFGRRLDAIVKSLFGNGVRDIVITTDMLIEDEIAVGGVTLNDYLIPNNEEVIQQKLKEMERVKSEKKIDEKKIELLENSDTEDIMNSVE